MSCYCPVFCLLWKSMNFLSQWYGYPLVLGIPIPKTLVIWASPVTLTLTLTQVAKVIWKGDARITRILGMRMPKTRGCPHHCNIATVEARKLGRVSSRKDFWDCFWGQEKIGQLLSCARSQSEKSLRKITRHRFLLVCYLANCFYLPIKRCHFTFF